jgi:hypothetical protein
VELVSAFPVGLRRKLNNDALLIAARVHSSRGTVMSKRLHVNYSLWPERARPGRSTPLASAVGGFAIGVVFVVAAYNSFPDAGIAGAGQEPSALSDLEHAPIFAYAVAAKPAVPLETANRGGRPRTPETDGRGGAEPARSVAALGAESGNSEGLIHEEGSISTGTGAEEAKPATTTVRKKSVREKRRKISREKRKKAVRTSRRQPTRYRKRSPLVSETAIWY